MSASTAGAFLGLLLAIGALMVITSWAATRTPSLAQRVRPFVGRAQGHVQEPAPHTVWLALLRPRFLSRASDASLDRRLSRAGRSGQVDAYRLGQVVYGLVGLLAGGALGIALLANGAPVIGVGLLAVFGAIGGVLASDQHLVRQGKARQRRIGQQLPTVAELLAFAVAAGESPVVALERVANNVHGDLADEIRGAIADLRGGQSLDQALRGVSDRTGSADVESFVDGLIVSLERGTPLADVLRAQAADARAAERRTLMEIAGRKDVAMLIPVVFFILPTVVLIALFPGIRSLQLVVP